MEKIDFWKKYPSLLVGQTIPNGFIPDELYLPQEKIKNLSEETIRSSYFLLHDDPIKIPAILEQLKKMGAHPCQFFVLNEKSNHLGKNLKISVSNVFISPQDTSEEFRARLLQAIELNRSNILSMETTRFSANHDPALTQRALDRARLTHSLCIFLKVSPAQHAACLRSALTFENSVNDQLWFKNSILQPWPQDCPLASVLVDISELALRNPQSASFRQSYRNASSQLPFKYRTDLKNAVETCFQHIWGEHLNVA